MAEYPESNLKLRREQRKYFRFPVEGEAVLFLPESPARLRCAMLDLGLEGCRLRRAEEFPSRNGMPVEISFRLAGQNFRFAGVLQWSARNRTLGVQFQNMSVALREELAELLGSLREELEARTAEAEVAQVAIAEAVPEASVSSKPAIGQDAVAKDKTGTDKTGKNRTEKDKQGKGKAGKEKERRRHERHTVDGRARVRFLSLHAQYVGKILDVSMGGCRIRFKENIPVGAFRRVEVEFLVNGISMLMPGVTQAMHDRCTVGIRFVEVTERKRQQLMAINEELEKGIATG